MILHTGQKNWPDSLNKSTWKSIFTIFFDFEVDFRNRNISTESPNFHAQTDMTVLDLMQK